MQIHSTRLIAALALASALTTSFAGADIRGAGCFPSGDGLHPPVTTAAWIGAGVSCDRSSGHVYFVGSFVDLAGDGVSARLHGPADAGQDGPLIAEVALGGVTAGEWSHEVDLDGALIADLLAGRGYIVVTTAAYPGGEARAQLEAFTRIVPVTFGGAEMVPPVSTQAGGFGNLFITPSTGFVRFGGWFGGLAGEATRLAVHAPAWFGATGPEVLGQDVDVILGPALEGYVTTEIAEQLLAGNGYLMLRSDGYPDGEVRAQTLEIGTHIGTSFCWGLPNSLGGVATIQASGSPVVAHGDLTLSTGPLPPNQWGYFLVGSGSVSSLPAGSDGRLCLNGGVLGRFTDQVQNSGSTPGGWGSLSATVDFASLPIAGGLPIVPGDTWNFQAWYRDFVNGAPTSNFTRAVSIDFL